MRFRFRPTRAPGILRLSLSVVLLLVGPTATAEDVLVAEVWFDASPVLPASHTEPDIDPAEALLREARYVFSGMIYGFQFVYTPSDRQRRVEEVFELSHVAQIPWGAEGLRVVSTRRDKYRTYGRFYYTPSRSQQARLEAWSSVALPRSAAEAHTSIAGGREAKYGAIESAVREAIRGYLRTRIHNKPREIRGSITFVEPPKVRLDAGAYVARVKIALRVNDVREYEHF